MKLRPLRIPLVLAWSALAGGGLGAAVSCSSGSPDLVRGPCPMEDRPDAAKDAAEDVGCDAPLVT
jgi:hypothetical protein